MKKDWITPEIISEEIENTNLGFEEGSDSTGLS